MADKRADQHRDLDRQDQTPDKSHRFINEKIVRQPMTRRQIARKILLTIFCAVLFGVLSAICFVVSRPVAERILGQETPEESSQITIPKDEPETTAPAAAETEPTEPAMTEAVDEMVRSEMEKYRYSIDDLNKLYSNLRTIASDADDSLVVVHSIQHEKDWFDNPIETSGQFSGVVIARTRTEILILTPDKAVEAADSIEVAFPDGTMMAGIVKQSDTIMGLSVVSVDAGQMDSEQFKKVEAIKLGNSYGVKQGDMVVAIGAPAGIVHSSDYGNISYVVRNVHTVDGSSRVFYTSASGDAEAGTFLLNTSGELIGWVTDKYDEDGVCRMTTVVAISDYKGILEMMSIGWVTDKYDEDGVCRMTTVVAISDYKGILEMMSNGIPAPYFGIKGQEVSQAMADSGMPSGIYVISAVTDGPAYNAGIQPGDIITWMNGEKVGSLKDFQNQVESLHAGDKIKVAVLRNGKDEYTEIEFSVTVGAR